MAEPPPPPTIPLNTQQSSNEKGPGLPLSSRFPVLVSGQVSFTTAAAIKDIEQAPKNVYRLQVELQPRTNDATFTDAPWTLVARHFLSTIQLYDDTAIIIRKKTNAVANKISSPEELPENPEDFERDYAYDIKMKSPKSVTFKILIGTKQSYWKTFSRDGPLFAKLVANDWYVNYVRLESQGNVASIGHLLFAHNRYVNQEDVIKELKKLIYPTICNQIDVRVTKSKEYYYVGNKKVRVFTRWLTIDCPVDIASELSNLVMERWKELKDDPKFENFNLTNTIYVPRNKGLVKFSARIENIGKQNEFLKMYKDVTVLTNVKDIDATFQYTEEIGQIFEDDTQIGHTINLRNFLRSWKDNSTGKPAIIAIHRTNKEMEFSLLSGNENVVSIHKKIRAFINEIRKQNAFNGIRVGGTKGVISKQNHSNSINHYAKQNFSTERIFQQKPSKESLLSNEETTERERKEVEDNWKSPPTNTKKIKKGTKASLSVNFNDQRLIQQYRDVVVGNSYSNNNQGMYKGQNNSVPIMGNKKGTEQDTTNSNTITIHKGTQTGLVTNHNDSSLTNQQLFQQFLESKQFQSTLSKAVAPQMAKQVTSLIAPTIEKISHIETQVGELNEYVRGNTQWQDSQSNRQDNLQQSINQMQTSMNSILTLFNDVKEKEVGNKRSAPNTIIDPIKSPARKQKTDRTSILSHTPTQHDDEACNPQHMSQHTFSEETQDEAMPAYNYGEGDGQ